ncbi:DUF1902 domain-containing protein [Roseovarius atlanticus]|uniref:DUF1902 domain-containing protein n=1 Tax=Roseovarius atlanticus TaxID=1641875 RepID=UPI001C96F77A|nr:DUF1902 domain-containing protein [Roseovarius atlanticus]MBY5987252.1 DUF1902 domain-containing protein [Roseovarius atlanticus]MBY6125892.1 DUF1902 domain-containing protein [Roseovarius atlanticus]MBY6149647.1 DUF1902 domain-containing protein [Roseovarius atlanticus]
MVLAVEAEMSKRNFEITAVWDEDAKVWYAESDIVGLHVEAETLDEFEKVAREFASELIVENHYAGEDISKSSLASLIPAIYLKTGGNDKQHC